MSNIAHFQSGFTRMDNDLYETLISADLSGRELRVALAIHRQTAGYNRGSVRITASFIAEMTGLARENVSRAISSLLRQHVLYREGGSRSPLGICPVREWKIDPPSSVSKPSQCAKKITSTVTVLTHKKDINTNPLNLPSEDTVPQQEKSNPEPKVRFADSQFHVDPDVIARWGETFPRLDIDAEIKSAATWAADNPAKAKKDWQRFLSGWLRRASGRLRAVDETGVPVDKIIDLYHRSCPNHARVSVTSDAALRAMIVERWNESPAQQSGKDFWLPFFQKAARRSQMFYRGQSVAPRLEVILSRANFREIAEARQ